MSLPYIRKAYGVPAKRGMRVIYSPPNATPISGKIIAGMGGRLRVRPDSGGPVLNLHPTWHIEFVSTPPSRAKL